MNATVRAATELAGPGPATGADRIETLDVIRGVALFGILLMNIAAFGMPMFAYADPSTYGGAEGADLGAWFTMTLLFEGTMRGMFSLLFGAGAVLLLSRMEARGLGLMAADIYYRRNLWLILFGFVHGYLMLWFGDILWMYGIVGLFLFPLRHLRPASLFALGLAMLAALATWNLVDNLRAQALWQEVQEVRAVEAAGTELDEAQQATLDAWNELTAHRKPTDEMLEADLAAHRGGYLDLLAYNAEQLAWWHTWGFYRWGFLDVFGMMLIGMALMKAGFLTLRRRSRDYALMVLIGYGVGLAINQHEIRLLLAEGFAVPAWYRAEATYDAGRLAMTMGHVGALLLLCRAGFLPRLLKALGAVGRMALTNYLMHTVLCVLIFSGFGLGLYGDLQRHQLYYVVGGIWLLQLVLSPLWLSHFRFGPAEWLWRSLTYRQRQPMRRGVA